MLYEAGTVVGKAVNTDQHGSHVPCELLRPLQLTAVEAAVVEEDERTLAPLQQLAAREDIAHREQGADRCLRVLMRALLDACVAEGKASVVGRAGREGQRLWLAVMTK